MKWCNVAFRCWESFGVSKCLCVDVSVNAVKKSIHASTSTKLFATHNPCVGLQYLYDQITYNSTFFNKIQKSIASRYSRSNQAEQSASVSPTDPVSDKAGRDHGESGDSGGVLISTGALQLTTAKPVGGGAGEATNE